jgi:hypothetical protein
MSWLWVGLSQLSRRLIYASSLGLAVLVVVWVIWRQGRAAGEARFAVKRAEARVRVLQKAAEVRRNVDAEDHTGVARRLSRWMRNQGHD